MTIPPTPITTKMQRCPKTPVNGVPRHHTVGLARFELATP